MSQMVFFVVQPVERSKKGRAVGGAAIRAGNHALAVQMAERLAPLKPGVFAYSRSVNLESGDHSDPVIIARLGEVPDHVIEALAA